MASSTDKLIVDVLALPREARSLLAEKLLEPLDFEEDFEVSDAWRAEIARRCRELDEGRAAVVSEQQAFAGAWRNLRK